MPAFVTMEAPDFTAVAVVNNEFQTVRLSDYRGKYVVLCFYPLDFTFVCPTELIAFSDKIGEFHKRGAEVLGVSVDSEFCHLAWIKTPRADGGLGGLSFPLLSDLTKSICRDYGVLMETGVSLRGTFLIDRNGVLRHVLVNDLPLGRNTDETIRMIDALQFFEQHGEVCPANWKPGARAINPRNAGRPGKSANM